MLIKIIRSTIVNKMAQSPGDVVDVSEVEARMLVSMGKAEYHSPEPGPAVEIADHPVIEQAVLKRPSRRK